MEKVSEWISHGGRQQVWKHASTSTGTEMQFSIFLPAGEGPFPLVTYLSGLTCTHANVTEKGEFRAACAELGLAFLAPDTSPRGPEVADDPVYDLGQGAGFYVDATQTPWAPHFNMWSYITKELPELVARHFPIDLDRQGIMGHSMGGHGALTIALRNADTYKSVSAFAPIVAPTQVPWGQKAFSVYLGPDQATWLDHDAVALIDKGATVPTLLVDVGTSDSFLSEQLKPELLQNACQKNGINCQIRLQEGYDHSYYFISSFMAEHLHWHAKHLTK